MKALISTLEPIETGYRVAQVSEQSFDVTPQLFWVDCADDIVADMYWYDPTDSTIKLVPIPEVVIQPQPISEGAQDL